MPANPLTGAVSPTDVVGPSDIVSPGIGAVSPTDLYPQARVLGPSAQLPGAIDVETPQGIIPVAESTLGQLGLLERPGGASASAPMATAGQLSPQQAAGLGLVLPPEQATGLVPPEVVPDVPAGGTYQLPAPAPPAVPEGQLRTGAERQAAGRELAQERALFAGQPGPAAGAAAPADPLLAAAGQIGRAQQLAQAMSPRGRGGGPQVRQTERIEAGGPMLSARQAEEVAGIDIERRMLAESGAMRLEEQTARQAELARQQGEVYREAAIDVEQAERRREAERIAQQARVDEISQATQGAREELATMREDERPGMERAFGGKAGAALAAIASAVGGFGARMAGRPDTSAAQMDRIVNQAVTEQRDAMAGKEREVERGENLYARMREQLRNDEAAHHATREVLLGEAAQEAELLTRQSEAPEVAARGQQLAEGLRDAQLEARQAAIQASAPQRRVVQEIRRGGRGGGPRRERVTAEQILRLAEQQREQEPPARVPGARVIDPQRAQQSVQREAPNTFVSQTVGAQDMVDQNYARMIELREEHGSEEWPGPVQAEMRRLSFANIRAIATAFGERALTESDLEFYSALQTDPSRVAVGMLDRLRSERSSMRAMTDARLRPYGFAYRPGVETRQETER
jgi:hypothetical protein